jgi:RHH-type rel operon transcriptional repressor/antitoxin RelB
MQTLSRWIPQKPMWRKLSSAVPARRSSPRQALSGPCYNVYIITRQPMSTTMTIRLEPAVKNRLDRLSQATHRSKSFLAAQAIQEYVETNEWQIQEIRAALAEADASDFASDADVKAVLDEWHGHKD